MQSLKYKVIKTGEQYNEYRDMLEHLLEGGVGNTDVADEVELLNYLIKKWDDEHNGFQALDPIALFKHLMEENGLKAKDLVDILGVSKGLVSDILHYKKGLSKEVIRALAAHFKLSQEAFNKPFKLILPINSHLRNASVMNTTKEMVGGH